MTIAHQPDDTAPYIGTRDDAGAHVHRMGKPLHPYNGLHNHSPDGFEWGYGGSGPAQLALALVADVLGVQRNTRAPGLGRTAPESVLRTLRVYQDVKWRIVARLPRDGWTLTRGEIIDAIGAVEREQAQRDASRPTEG